MKKIDSCNIDRGGVNSFTLRLLEESVLENGQADLCTAMEETECHRLQLIQFFIDYLYKICGRVVHLSRCVCESGMLVRYVYRGQSRVLLVHVCMNLRLG